MIYWRSDLRYCHNRTVWSQNWWSSEHSAWVTGMNKWSFNRKKRWLSCAPGYESWRKQALLLVCCLDLPALDL